MKVSKNIFAFLLFLSLSTVSDAQSSTQVNPKWKKLSLGKQVFELHNVTGEIIKFQGKEVLKIERDLKALPFDSTNIEKTVDEPHYAKLIGLDDFENGTIEVKMYSQLQNPAPYSGIAGFIGVYFRIKEDDSAFEGIYLRPLLSGKIEFKKRKEAIKASFLVIFSLPQPKIAMSKGSFFTGQPIFNQILSFIPRSLVSRIARESGSDRYCKSLKSYDHLVTMLYATFNRCTSLREVTTGMLAWEHRIAHLGMKSHPRRSTLSDANSRRSEQVFEQIYLGLLDQYRSVLPDSRKRSKKNNLYIFDSTSIALFQEILKGSGLRRSDGKNKGGIKVHTLLNSGQDVPVMIRYSPAADNDVRFLKEVKLNAGSVIVFDRGYCDYRTYNRFTSDRVTFVTRKLNRSVYQIDEQRTVSEEQIKQGVLSDCNITLGYTYLKKAVQVRARLVRFKDPVTQKEFEFITNNRRLRAITVANYYRQRWQIETFFKRIKQNYELQYFLGDNANAIKIQIWCALIADLILKVIRKGSKSKMAFSNLTGLVRLHLMTYLDLNAFLKWPEKSLLNKIQQQKQVLQPPNLFKT